MTTTSPPPTLSSLLRPWDRWNDGWTRTLDCIICDDEGNDTDVAGVYFDAAKQGYQWWVQEPHGPRYAEGVCAELTDAMDEADKILTLWLEHMV